MLQSAPMAEKMVAGSSGATQSNWRVFCTPPSSDIEETNLPDLRFLPIASPLPSRRLCVATQYIIRLIKFSVRQEYRAVCALQHHLSRSERIDNAHHFEANATRLALLPRRWFYESAPINNTTDMAVLTKWHGTTIFSPKRWLDDSE